MNLFLTAKIRFQIPKPFRILNPLKKVYESMALPIALVYYPSFDFEMVKHAIPCSYLQHQGAVNTMLQSQKVKTLPSPFRTKNVCLQMFAY